MEVKKSFNRFRFYLNFGKELSYVTLVWYYLIHGIYLHYSDAFPLWKSTVDQRNLYRIALNLSHAHGYHPYEWWIEGGPEWSAVVCLLQHIRRLKGFRRNERIAILRTTKVEYTVIDNISFAVKVWYNQWYPKTLDRSRISKGVVFWHPYIAQFVRTFITELVLWNRIRIFETVVAVKETYCILIIV